MQQTFISALKERGASLVGFADLTKLPREQARGYRVGISAGIALQKSVVAGIPTGPHPDYDREYAEVNKRLDELALFAEDMLKKSGEDACGITIKHAPYDRIACRTQLPHKTVARLAGHGWIGRNALLITPEFGSAIRFTTILTNAPFATNTYIPANRCGICRRCADACPGAAIRGALWEEGIDRDELVSAAACQETFRVRGNASGQQNGTCGICIAVCPHTNRYLIKSV